jgi:hypothetical protein
MSTKKSSPRSAKKKPAAIVRDAATLAAVRDRAPRQHHAYVLHGSPESLATVTTVLPDLLDITGIDPLDVHHFDFSDGSVDDVRALQARVYLAPRGETALFVVFAPQLTLAAQNALLKVLEDPPIHACIVLAVRSPLSLIPTIRSRVHPLFVRAAADAYDAEARLLFSLTPEDRLARVERSIESRDTTFLVHVCEALARMIETRVADGTYPSTLRAAQDLEEIASVITTLTIPGAMIKVALESLLLTLPVIA